MGFVEFSICRRTGEIDYIFQIFYEIRTKSWIFVENKTKKDIDRL
jgi:Holliday junction resolvase-like predicted endonuclease